MRYREVHLADLTYVCQTAPPAGAEGAQVTASADPGMGRMRIYERNFDLRNADGQAETLLHESFHASFSEFDHDSYSGESDYPGSSPLTNADSYSVIRLQFLRINQLI